MEYITASLRCHGGNVSRSAAALGLHRNTLRNKVADLGVKLEELRSSGS